MPTFFAGDGENSNADITMTAPVGANENASASKSRFSLFRKKSKTTGPAPQQQGPPTLPPLQGLAPPTPPPVEEAPRRAATPKPRRVTKKPSTDIDDELRRHLQREGYAFLAFTDPAKAAAHSGESPAEPAAGRAKGVVDPAECSRSHGTLLRDAVELMEKKSTETAHPAVSNMFPSLQAAAPPRAAPTQVAKASVGLAAPRPNAAAAARTENFFPTRVDSAFPPVGTAPTSMSSVAAAPGPSISGAGRTSGLRTTASRMAEAGPPQSRPPVPRQHPTEGSIMDRKIVRKSSDQSNKDSGKDVDSHRSAGPSQRSSPVYPVAHSNGATAQESAGPSRRSSPEYPVEPPAGAATRNMAAESPAMARLTQEASMHDLDPRMHDMDPQRSRSRKSGSHGERRQSRRRPPPEQMRRPTSGPSPDQPHAPRRSRPENRPPTNAESEAQTPAMSDEERRQSDTSADDSPRRSLPTPVMLPPTNYMSTLSRLQLSCEISHRQTVVSPNLHHRIVCMVCQTDAPSERWSCSYCALRFCSMCRSEFAAGATFEQVLEKAAAEKWQSRPATTAASPKGNIPWDIACILEAGGRMGGHGVRPPPPGRRPPPPMRRHSPVHNSGGERSTAHRSGKSSPEQRVRPTSNRPPSPAYSAERVKSSSRSSSSHRYRGGAVSPGSSLEEAPAVFDREGKRKVIGRIMNGNRTSGRCSPGLTGGTAAEQRRALLGGGPY